MNFADTKNNKRWNFTIDSTSGSFRVKDTGLVRMVISDDGNIGIGMNAPTSRLHVNGDANFSGSINVDGGKGIVQNASASSTLKMYIGQFTILYNFTINSNSYATYSISWPSGMFNTTPTVSLGQLLSTPTPFGEIGKLVMSISSASGNTAVVRFYNPTDNNIQIKGAWKIVCIGE